jgi:hypothetical protein
VQYFLAYRFVFQSPNWLKNLLFGSLCFFVPIAGTMVLIGYLFEVIEWLHRRRQEEKLPWVERPEGLAPSPPGAIQAEPGQAAATFLEDATEGAYPDFDMNRLQAYLMRGIWPFLVQMLVQLPVTFLFICLYGLTMILVAVGSASGGPPWIILAVFLVGLPVSLLVALVCTILVVPLYLRVGLSQDFGSAFSMALFKDFFRRAGKEVVLSRLFLQASAVLVSVLGMMVCVVGIYPAAVLCVVAAHHLDYQLYELYLQRGGEPIRPRADGLGMEKSL